MELESLFQTHAEVAIALTGFASVIAALRRPLSVQLRQRFASLLALAVLQILGCLLPLWCLRLFASPARGWSLLSGLLLSLNLARVWWFILRPTRQLGAQLLVVINPFTTRLVVLTFAVSLGSLLLDAIGAPFGSGPDLYYAGQLGMLLIGFALFADVAVAED